MDPVALSLFAARLAAVCDEMGAALRRAAFSPNIRERLDYSCAFFAPSGRLAAQAAHIPVHLGSMAFAMTGIAGSRRWRAGEGVIFNDPFAGGTHLPDVTVVLPVFADGIHVGFVANRAHHADIGASSPGSMPLSTTLAEEGLLIEPHVFDDAALCEITASLANPTRARGDFAAQASANATGAARVAELVARLGHDGFAVAIEALDAYGARSARAALREIPDGEYRYTDYLDDDGAGTTGLPIAVALRVADGEVAVDFAGSAPQCGGNLNCPLPVTAAAVWYAFRCLMPDEVPACAGAFDAVTLEAPPGSVVNAAPGAAVAAGNVETSQRIVDAVLGALAQAVPERIPAAAQGTMNNVALGGRGDAPWDYYETLAGGLGAHARGAGLSAVQAHMTNTWNTPAEVLELELPLRVRVHAVRDGSGGAGKHRGGDGLVRELEFLAPASATLLTERRRRGPWGLAGGADGAPGRNTLNGDALPGKCELALAAGDRLRIETPGGGGWGGAAGL